MLRSTMAALLAVLLGLLSALGASDAEQTPAPRAADTLGIVWSNPPANSNPLTRHNTYHSAAMNCEVGYNIYLPPGYDTGAVRYPVMYWLHGLGENENTNIFLAQVLDTAIKAKKLPPMILVCANGGQSTRYYDSLDGSIMAETTIVKELIPHIDATYRTLATREGRAIQGFSMGGMGAFKFAFKYPELFSSAMAFAPALPDPDMEAHFVTTMFHGDKTLFIKDNALTLLVTNAGKIRGNLPIRIVTGSDDGVMRWSDQLHASMVKLRISHEFETVGGVGHDIRGLMRYEQLRAFGFAADRYSVHGP